MPCLSCTNYEKVNDVFKIIKLILINIIAVNFRSASKLEDAADLYVRAANMFKMAKNWSGMCLIGLLTCFYFIL